MKKVLSVMLATLMVISLLPGVLLGVSASERTILPALTPDQDGRIYYLYENFETHGNLQGADAVAARLGLTVPENAALSAAHDANLAATEGGEDVVYMYELRDGQLYLRNRGTANEVMLISTSADLAAAMKGEYAVEYTLTYLPTTTAADGYFGLLYAFDGTSAKYGSSAVRISGYGNNAGYSGAAFDSGDASFKYTSDLCSSTAYMLNNIVNPTLYERVFGDLDVYPEGSNNYDLRGSKILSGVEIHVALEFDGVHGPAMYVNGVLVSAPVDTVSAKAAYSELIGSDSLGIGFLLTPGTECILDDLMVYGYDSGEEEEPAQGSLYMTEICLTPAVSGAQYIEVYNNGSESVDLGDFGLALVKSPAGTWNGTTKYTNYIRFSDYIGKKLTFGSAATTTVMENPGSMVLEPGSCAVLYFATAAENSEEDPHLGAKIGDVYMAKFREAYGIGADVPVLGIPTVKATDEAGQTVQASTATLGLLATYPYNFTLVQDKDSEGTAISWSDQSPISVDLEQYIESRVEYLPVLASGYSQSLDDTSFTDSTRTYADGTPLPIYYFGGGGAPLPGYAAQYLYAANAAENYNVGTMISRAFRTIEEEGNVGALLPVQESYFEKLISRLTNGYADEGNLVITEFVPRTGNLAGAGDKDAFEAFEVTNTSKLTLDLYDYGLVSSGKSLYGNITDWTRATLFEATPATGVAAEDAALARYENPSEFALAPGASVVIWNFREDTVSAGALDGTGTDGTDRYYTVTDFRTYHHLDESVTVIVAAAFDSVKGVIAENETTVSYGIATAEAIAAYRDGTADKVSAVVSDVTVPMSSLYFSTRIDTYDFLETMAVNPVIGSYMIHYGFGAATKVTLDEGASLAGYYTRVDTGKVGIGSVKTNIYMYSPCDAAGTAVADGEYYTLSAGTSTAYGSYQDICIPVGYSVNIAYGEMLTDAATSGAVAGGLSFSKYSIALTRVSTTNEITYLKSASSAYITAESVNGALSATNTLGVVETTALCTVVWEDADGNAFSTIRFLPSNCRGTYTILPDFYAHWLVNGEPYNAGDKVALTGDTVIRASGASLNAYSVSLRVAETEEESGLRFTTAVSKELYGKLVATYGAENVHLKTAIAPARYFAEAESATVEALDLLGHGTNYLVTEAEGFFDESDTEFIFAGSLVNIRDKDMEFAGIGYLEVDTGDGVLRYYGETASLNRAVETIAKAELLNVAQTETDVYCYPVEEDRFSPYTQKEREVIASLCR